MNARQAKQVLVDWLEENIPNYPGICGAHLVGSITGMPDEAEFPPYKDLDFHLVFEEGSPALESKDPFGNILETAHRGVILEGGLKPVSDYRPLEKALSNPEIAHHLTTGSILYDPGGWLHNLQVQVSAEYARRRWVRARVEWEREALRQMLAQRTQAQALDPTGALEAMLIGYAFTFITSALRSATLQAPTSGSRMLLHLCDMLETFNRLDLYEESLAIIGVKGKTREEVERFLAEGIEVFDLAVQYRRGPHPFQHKLNAHQRDYFAGSLRALLEEGQPEHAMTWLTPFYVSASSIILRDGPDPAKLMWAERLANFLDALGMGTPEAREARFTRAGWLFDQFFTLAERIVAGNPDIND